MKIQKIENISLLIIVAVATIIGLLHMFGFIDHIIWMSNKISSYILVLLGLLSTYLIISNISIKNSLDSFDRRLIDTKEQLLVSLKGVESQVYYNPEEAFSHLSNVIINSKHSIDQVAIAPTPQLQEEVLQDYINSLNKVLYENKVKYRYVSEDSYGPRWQRLTGFTKDKNIQKFYLRFFSSNSKIKTIPILNFFIFDNKEIFMRYPHEPGQPEIYLLVKQQDVVEIFRAYYDRIWEAANPYK
jgi:hypothetical protein